MKPLMIIMVALMLMTITETTIASVSTPAVVRYDRYLLVNTAPGLPTQEQLTTLSVPPGFHPSTGETLQYLLRGSGYTLCLPDSQRAWLYAFPLPLGLYHFGPVRLDAALQMLAGSAWQLEADHMRREICFKPQARLPANDSLLPAVMHRRPLSHPVLGPATAPFFLAGMIQRGETRLAVIVPPDALWLNQVVWLRKGERWQGWQLEKLDEQQAVFRHGKRRLTLTMPE